MELWFRYPQNPLDAMVQTLKGVAFKDKSRVVLNDKQRSTLDRIFPGNWKEPAPNEMGPDGYRVLFTAELKLSMD